MSSLTKTASVLFLLISFPIYSFEIERRGEKLYLQSASCLELSKLVPSLKEWTDNIGDEKKCSGMSPSKIKRVTDSYGEDKKTFCEVDISDCVPKHVLKYQGVNPKIQGPNCANLALVMKEILPALRFTSSEEMSFYMRPPLCRQLANNEAKKAGDLGAIRNIFRNEIGEDHAFIYISDELSYSKNGAGDNSWPYKLQSLNEMLKIYAVPDKKECRQNQVDLTCKKALSYFRCISMEQYLNENKDLVLKELVTSINNFKSWEDCLQKNIFENRPLNEPMKIFLTQSTNALIAFLNKSTTNHEQLQSPENRFILGSLKLRLQAIIEQLDFMDDSDLDLEQETEILSKIFESSVQSYKKNGY